MEQQFPRGPTSIGCSVTYPHVNKQDLLFYGLPQHITQLGIQDTHKLHPYRQYNLDQFDDRFPHQSVYGTVPIAYSRVCTNKQGQQSKQIQQCHSAFFWCNSSDTIVNYYSKQGQNQNHSFNWTSEAGTFDCFIFASKEFSELTKKFAQLCGRCQIPPMFSLGYHQCRWNYMSEEEVIDDVIFNMDKHQIPCDAVWLDIEHTDGKRYGTFDPKLFPNGSKQMVKALGKRGRKLVCIVDPHIKVDDDWQFYKMARQLSKRLIFFQCILDLFIIDKDTGKPIQNECWPKNSSWLDFLNPKASQYWGDLYSKQALKDVFIWNDMNEPAVFDNRFQVSLPKYCLHYQNREHREVHNLYGILSVKATYQGLIKRDSNQRPFILSRSFFAGSQKYSAVWTGDSQCSWKHLRMCIPMMINNSICGIGFIGADIPGFYTDYESQEQYIRWYQLGAFMPFCRAHANSGTKRRQPWLLSEQTLQVVRDILRLRYKLVPYLYTCFHQMASAGTPILKPFWWDDKEFGYDLKVYENTQFLFGDNMMIKPILQKGIKESEIYLQQNDSNWYNFFTGQLVTEKIYKMKQLQIDSVGVFVKGGSIIVQKEITQDRQNEGSKVQEKRFIGSMLELKSKPYQLSIFPDKNGYAQAQLYMDDGTSFNYAKSQDYLMWRLTFTNKNIIKSTKVGGKMTKSQDMNEDGSLNIKSVLIASENQLKNFEINKVQVTEGGNCIIYYLNNSK